jgi:hypothetical protein
MYKLLKPNAKGQLVDWPFNPSNFCQNAVIGPAGKAVPLSRPERTNKPAVPLVSALPLAIRQPNRRYSLCKMRAKLSDLAFKIGDTENKECYWFLPSLQDRHNCRSRKRVLFTVQ